MKIALVTDSTCDLPVELTEKFNIHVVPNIMVIDGQSLEDGKGITRREFYDRLPAMTSPPTTATAAPGVYQQLYQRLLDSGAEFILSIHAASFLSGIYNAAYSAALSFGNRVRVIDSQQVTLGLGFQVLSAGEAVLKGLNVEAIIEVMSSVRNRVRVIAMLDTLEYLHRSGRVSWARARLGSLLSIKPFIEVDTQQVRRLGESRTRRKGIERLIEIVQSLGTLERLAILHTNAEEDALYLMGRLQPMLKFPALIVNITTIIGTHVGPNGLGVAVVLQGAE